MALLLWFTEINRRKFSISHTKLDPFLTLPCWNPSFKFLTPSLLPWGFRFPAPGRPSVWVQPAAHLSVISLSKSQVLNAAPLSLAHQFTKRVGLGWGMWGKSKDLSQSASAQRAPVSSLTFWKEQGPFICGISSPDTSGRHLLLPKAFMQQGSASFQQAHSWEFC